MKAGMATLRAALPSVDCPGLTHPAGTEAVILTRCGDVVCVELGGDAWFEVFELSVNDLDGVPVVTPVAPALDADDKARLANRELWRVRRQFATLLIRSRYGHDDPLDPELDAVVRELVLEHDKARMGRCEWCNTRAPLKAVKDPHGADCIVDVCAWGCGDEP